MSVSGKILDAIGELESSGVEIDTILLTENDANELGYIDGAYLFGHRAKIAKDIYWTMVTGKKENVRKMSSNWLKEIYEQLSEISAMYPGAEKEIQVSELMYDYIKLACRIPDSLKGRIDIEKETAEEDVNPKTSYLYGVPLTISDRVITYRIAVFWPFGKPKATLIYKGLSDE